MLTNEPYCKVLQTFCFIYLVHSNLCEFVVHPLTATVVVVVVVLQSLTTSSSSLKLMVFITDCPWSPQHCVFTSM